MRANPDTYELRIHRSDFDRRTNLEVYSRRYDVRLGYRLRNDWGDPRRLAEFVDRLVGGTLQAWESAEVSPASGREMALALMPHWEREIHHFMERMEYEDRHHRHRNDMMDAMLYGTAPRYIYGDFAPPPEDPKAKQKARELLIRNLDAGQEKSFKKDGEFRVTAKDGKAYTIKTARSFNVVGPDGAKYCGQLRDTPVEDQMLAQKLLLEHEPEKFFKNANVSPAPTGREFQYSIVNDPIQWMVQNIP